MHNQKRRIGFELVLAISLCLFMISNLVTATGGESERLNRTPPTLEDLAKLNFVWAQKMLKEYNNGHIRFLTDGPKRILWCPSSKSWMFWKKKSIGTPLKSIKDKAVKAKFLRSGFYDELLFSPNDLDLVKQTAALLVELSKPNSNSLFLQLSITKDIPNLIALYVTLNEKPYAKQITQTTVLPEHMELADILARWIHQKVFTPDEVDELERAVMGPKKPVESESSDNQTPTTPAVIYSQVSRTLTQGRNLYQAPLVNGMHPLNRELYSYGLNYMYDSKRKTFVFIKHKQTLRDMAWDARFSFEDAVRLRHARDNEYKIVIEKREIAHFQKAMQNYLGYNENKKFQRDSSQLIKSFKEYEKSQNPKKSQHKNITVNPKYEELVVTGHEKIEEVEELENEQQIATEGEKQQLDVTESPKPNTSVASEVDEEEQLDVAESPKSSTSVASEVDEEEQLDVAESPKSSTSAATEADEVEKLDATESPKPSTSAATEVDELEQLDVTESPKSSTSAATEVDDVEQLEDVVKQIKSKRRLDMTNQRLKESEEALAAAIEGLDASINKRAKQIETRQKVAQLAKELEELKETLKEVKGLEEAQKETKEPEDLEMQKRLAQLRKELGAAEEEFEKLAKELKEAKGLNELEELIEELDAEVEKLDKEMKNAEHQNVATTSPQSS
ncbi:hypothetical protein NEHOM01_0850 [Nematocida homosporus]|uniref:uncharacterized protein n=1 Tax=Nematocida homosporus TaxID=1912981 RepID=UPI00221E9952|nr:uncharacterized protein NEHOM01_0850 [Nematocida homosporus]KAI5185491.1 hypothetical protein NEHOM01_0850 [Nematocida homosporus]